MTEVSTGVLPVARCRTTAALHERIAEITSAAKALDRLAPVTLVVDSAYSGTLLRRQLIASGGLGVGTANLRLVTLPEFITDLAVCLGVPESNGVPRLVSEAVVDSVLAQETDLLANIRDHPSTAVRLADVLDELAWCPLDDTSVAAALTLASSTTASVIGFVRKVRAELEAKHGVRPLATVAADVTAALSARLAHALELGTVIVLAQAIPGPALAMIGALASATDVHVLDLDPAVVPHPAFVLDCPDPGTEVAFAVRQVVETIANGTPPDQVALLYGTSNPYAALLANELDAAHLAWHGPAAGSLASTALARATGTLLAMATARVDTATGISRPLLLRWINAAPVLVGDSLRPTWNWRRLIRDKNLYADSAGWRTTLTALVAAADEPASVSDADPDSEERARSAAQRTAESAQSLATGLDDLGSALEAMLASATWEQLGGSVWAVLEQFHLGGGWWRAHTAERQACDRIRTLLLEELPSLDGVGAGAPFDASASAEALAQLLTRDLLARRGRVGDMGTGVHVGPVTSAAIHLFQQVVVVGAAEGLLPPLVVEDPLLPDPVRAALRAVPADLATTGDRISRVRSAYASVVGAADVALVTYPRAAVAGRANLPRSRFLRGVSEDLTRRVDSRLAAFRQPDGDISALPTPVTDTDLSVLRLLASGDVPGHLVPRRDAALSGAHVVFDRFHGNLDGIADIGEVWSIDGLRISASAIESYLHCPAHFFVQRVLGIGTDAIVDEIDEAGAADVGTLLHRALEMFVTQSRRDGLLPAPGDSWPEGSVDRLRAVFDVVVADAEEQGLLGWAPAWARRRRVIIDSFDSWLDVDAAEVRSGPALAPESTELEFGMGDGPDVPVTLNDGSVVWLRGAIDRLDISDDGLCVGVVDYKTGKSAKFKDLLGIPRPRGAVPRREKVQDLVYDAAARVLHPRATDIKVSFVFVPDLGTVTAVVPSHVEDRPAALLNQLEVLAEAGRRGHFAPLPGGRYDYCPVCKVMGRQAARAAEAAGVDVADDSGEVDVDG